MGDHNKYYLKDSPVNSTITAAKMAYDSTTYLTGREIETLSLLAQGLNNTSISNRLYVNVKSIENYINSIYSKLNILEEESPRVVAVLKWQKDVRDDEATFLRPGGSVFKITPYWETSRISPSLGALAKKDNKQAPPQGLQINVASVRSQK